MMNFSRFTRILNFNPLPSYEGRPVCIRRSCRRQQFQSTPLIRGETIAVGAVSSPVTISIHSPHTRGDLCALILTGAQKRFQSTPLIRGETCVMTALYSSRTFQSTPLIRGETLTKSLGLFRFRISIHSPHTRGDMLPSSDIMPSAYFNPLPSYEGRLPLSEMFGYSTAFQSTPLIRGETLSARTLRGYSDNFNPLPSYEGRRYGGARLQTSAQFQSTPLIRGETGSNSKRQ